MIDMYDYYIVQGNKFWKKLKILNSLVAEILGAGDILDYSYIIARELCDR